MHHLRLQLTLTLLLFMSCRESKFPETAGMKKPGLLETPALFLCMEKLRIYGFLTCRLATVTRGGAPIGGTGAVSSRASSSGWAGSSGWVSGSCGWASGSSWATGRVGVGGIVVLGLILLIEDIVVSVVVVARLRMRHSGRSRSRHYHRQHSNYYKG